MCPTRFDVSDRRLERVHKISAFPAEAAIRFGRTAEMAIGRGAFVDRLVQLQMHANAARGEVHHLWDRQFDCGCIDIARAMRIGVD